jgi:YfiH family protein
VNSWLWADWSAPLHVRAGVSTRQGGVSPPPLDSLNLGLHVGDVQAIVLENRRRLAEALGLPGEPVWLAQEHGSAVARLPLTGLGSAGRVPVADAAVTGHAGVVCAVMTADCLPVVLCDRDGTRIGVAHAGWRGLAGGVLEATLAALAIEPVDVIVWLGPAISQPHFEVGVEVREAFLQADAGAEGAFSENARGRWQADLYALARRRLALAGVSEIFGGELCTWSAPHTFFSHRRDGHTGRMATLVWLEPR